MLTFASAAVHTAASTLNAALTTSGPIPSPGSTTMFAITRPPRCATGPASTRAGATSKSVIAASCVSVSEMSSSPSRSRRRTNGSRWNLKRQIAAGHRLCLEVHGDGDPRLLGGEVEEGAHLVCRKRDRDEPAAERVGVEDVAERFGDDGTNPVVGERPDRVLARRPAAEVAAGHEHGPRRVLGLVQHEVRARRSGAVASPVVEQDSRRSRSARSA